MRRAGLRRLGIGTDVGLTVMLQFVNAAVTFGLQAMVVRALDKESVGLYFLTWTYIIIATSIADFGVVAAVLPKMSVARGAETPAFKAGLVVRMLAIVLGWVCINIYLLLFGQPHVLLTVNIGFSAIFFSSKFSGVRQYLEMLWRLQGRTYVVTIIAVIDALVTAGLVGILWWSDHLDSTTVWVMMPLGSIPGFIVVLWPIVRQLRQSNYFQRRIPIAYYRRIAMASLPVAVMAAMGQLFGQLEVLVINARLSLEDVGAFSTSLRPLSGTLFLAIVVSVGVMPIVAQLRAGVRREVTLDYIISVVVRLVGLVGLTIVAICILFDAQIMAIFGRAYVAEGHLLELNSLANCLTFLVILFDQTLLATGRRIQTLIGASFSFALALVIELSIIRFLGINGVIYAKMFAIAALILYQLYAVGSEIRRSAIAGLKRLLVPAGTLAVALLTTGQLSLIPRGGVVLTAFALSLIALRTVSAAELRTLRAIRAV